MNTQSWISQAIPGPWLSWTPSYTNFTVGNGTLGYAKYIQIGKTVFFRYKFTLGSTSAVSGQIRISAPVAVNGDYSASPLGVPIGVVNADSTAAFYTGFVLIGTAGTLETWFQRADATRVTGETTSSSAPFVWGTNSVLWLTGNYETT